MIRLTTENIIALHCRMARETGGSAGIRDLDLLESAIESPFSSFGGIDLYPTIEEKAARLGYSLISNHAFIDGNKRIGIYAMLVFLEVNGIRLNCANSDVIAAGLGSASGQMDYDGLLNWILLFRR